MTLPTSGPINFSNLQGEFGGTNPISLSEYYAGGGLVPSGTTGTNGAVPSSGAINVTIFYGTSNGFAFSNTISADTNNYNVSTKAVDSGWDGVTKLIATITINSGVVVGSVTAGAAFLVAHMPVGSGITIINNGFIVGKGGKGGIEGGSGAGAAGNGTVGGLALSVVHATTINNLNGTIGGGGGGGGGGAVDDGHGGGGGGGAGRDTGLGGTSSGTAGQSGTYNTRGLGGGHTGPDAGDGGNGGTLGVAGTDGTGSTNNNGGIGAAAGACTSGNSNITWTNNGIRLGTLG